MSENNEEQQHQQQQQQEPVAAETPLVTEVPTSADPIR